MARIDPTPTPRRHTLATPGTVRDARGGLVALTIATFAAITTEMLPVGLLPQIGDALDVSEGTTGLLVTVYAFMVAALAIPLTLATRRFPRKALLLATLAAYTVSNAAVALSPGFALVAAGRALGGLSHAVFFSVSIGYAARLVRPQFTGRAMALVTSGASAGFVLGIPLSTTLGEAVGWRAAFWSLAALCAVTFGLVTALLPPVDATTSAPDTAEPSPGSRPGARPGSTRASSRRSLLAVVVTTNALVYLGQYTVYTYVTVLLLAADLPDGGVGPVLLGVGGVGLLGLWYSAVRLDRAPRAAAISVLAVMVATLVALGVAMPHLPGVLVAVAVWGVSFGAVASIFQTAAVRTRAASPDIAGALVNASANVGIGGGAAVGALVLNHGGVDRLPVVGAAIAAVGLVVVLVARRAFPHRP
jgi:predicted MFS family arabinose efflux permease